MAAPTLQVLTFPATQRRRKKQTKPSEFVRRAILLEQLTDPGTIDLLSGTLDAFLANAGDPAAMARKRAKDLEKARRELARLEGAR